MSCPRTLPRKNPEDLVRLKPRTPGLRVKHFTTVPRGTLKKSQTPMWEKDKMLETCQCGVIIILDFSFKKRKGNIILCNISKDWSSYQQCFGQMYQGLRFHENNVKWQWKIDGKCAQQKSLIDPKTAKSYFNSFVTFIVSSANAFNLESYKMLSFGNELTLSQTSPGLYASAVQDFWKHCGKGEIARNEQFLLFPQCFLSVRRASCHFHLVWICRLQTIFIRVWNLLFGIGLNPLLPNSVRKAMT